MTTPRTHYAKADDGAHIAYQITGDGPDVIFMPWWWNHLETQWDDPLIAHFLDRLASFSRLILFDMRGVGLSDAVPLNHQPTLERWMEDAVAVLDAAQSRQAVVLGHGDGGLVAILLAATHPQRCGGLVLVDAYARLPADSNYPGWDHQVLDQTLASFSTFWGSGDVGWTTLIAPSRAQDHVFRERLARLERLSVSPGGASATQVTIGHLDVRPALSLISSPTLVLHHRENLYMPVFFGRYLASHITGASLVELDGADHLYWTGDPDATLAEIQQFVTGSRSMPQSERVLATVLFTDIAGSTTTAADLGDRRWRHILEQHNDLVRRQLERFRGHEVKTTGDGVLATFDGPARAIASACAIRDGARQIGLAVRAGIHTGEIEMLASDVAGISVHIGERICSLASAGEVSVSQTVKDLVVGSGIEFNDRGEHELKGVPGTWRLYAVEG